MVAEFFAKSAEFVLSFLWNGLHTIAYPVLLSLAIFAVIMYLGGCEKFAKYIPICTIIFTLIMAIGRM